MNQQRSQCQLATDKVPAHSIHNMHYTPNSFYKKNDKNMFACMCERERNQEAFFVSDCTCVYSNTRNIP